MPPRVITLAIVVFWLGATILLFWRDVWPIIRPGERPPFTIDLTREAAGRKSVNHWRLYRNGEPKGYANTATAFRPEDETYELTTNVRFENLRFKLPLFDREVELRRLTSMNRVTPDGELREIDSEVEIGVHFGGQLAPEAVIVHVNGQVANGLFRPQWTVKSQLFKELNLPSEPVEVRSHDSMLNPLQPWNRLLNVREGQQWVMTLFDPLSDSLAGMVPGTRPPLRVLDAGVLEGTQDHRWDNRDVPCLVIEYRGKDLTARTWVRKSDGLVLRQEAERPDNRLVLEREPR